MTLLLQAVLQHHSPEQVVLRDVKRYVEVYARNRALEGGHGWDRQVAPLDEFAASREEQFEFTLQFGLL